jgi:hypothetical protein
MEKEEPMFERSEFRIFPFFGMHKLCWSVAQAPEGRVCGRLSLNTFFGEAKKVFRPPGRDPACIYEGQSL